MATTDPHSLRVMSFNILTDISKDIRYAWALRQHLVLERIQAFQPDLLGLQECRQGEQANFLIEYLPEFHFIGVPRGSNDGSGREMAPIMIRRDTFEVLDSGHFWISKEPQRPSSKLFGTFYPRTASWAKLRPLAAPQQTLLFANTHFTYIPLVQRRAARIFKEQLLARAADLPLIVTGDFNIQAGTSAQQALLETADSSWRDALAGLQDESGARPGSFHRFGRGHPPTAIDWILTSDHFHVQEAAVDDFHEGQMYPSDHYPVTAVLGW